MEETTIFLCFLSTGQRWISHSLTRAYNYIGIDEHQWFHAPVNWIDSAMLRELISRVSSLKRLSTRKEISIEPRRAERASLNIAAPLLLVCSRVRRLSSKWRHAIIVRERGNDSETRREKRERERDGKREKNIYAKSTICTPPMFNEWRESGLCITNF